MMTETEWPWVLAGIIVFSSNFSKHVVFESRVVQISFNVFICSLLALATLPQPMMIFCD